MPPAVIPANAGIQSYTVSPPAYDMPGQAPVLSVTDLDSIARFFREIGSYVTKASGAVSASEVASWGLPPAAGGRCWYWARQTRTMQTYD